MKSVRVFFYGLFMDEAILRSKGCVPQEVERATVAGFELRIGRRATLVDHPAGLVHGLLVSLTEPEIDRLYADPSVQAYEPRAVSTRLADGTAITAVCYVLRSPPEPSERNPEYAAKLRALAGQLGFPKDYVASIR